MTSNDGQETPAEARARRRAELPPPGTVQEEAALLVDLLSQRRWAPPSGMPSGRAGEPAGPSATRGEEAGDQEARRPGTLGQDTSGAGGSSESGRRDDGSPHAPDDRGECTCGGRTPAACSVCPVCQLIAFVQQVNPETIDKVADFVGFAATALRDLATAQRERRSDDRPSAPDPEAGPASETEDTEEDDTREPDGGSPA